MKQLYIDPSGGVAGDMFAAALISAGADKELMTKAMLLAATKLGKANIETILTHDNATRLIIEVDHHQSNLSGHKSKHLISDIFNELKMEALYREFGLRALQFLIDAEIQAHRENTFLTDHHHHSHEHDHSHEHGHGYHHHEHHSADAFLHEAQDILIDITGAAYGLQLLGAETSAILTAPISLGGGTIKFSHGEMSAPAPATKIIIQSNWIPAQLGPIDTELCTPTGACILAALNCKSISEKPSKNSMFFGSSRGGKDLPIPSLKIFLY